MRGFAKELKDSGYFEEMHFSDEQSQDKMEEEYTRALNMLNACRTTRNGLIKRIRKNYTQSLCLENIKFDREGFKHFLELEKAYRAVKNYRIFRKEWD